jgi:hypothetical protein
MFIFQVKSSAYGTLNAMADAQAVKRMLTSHIGPETITKQEATEMLARLNAIRSLDPKKFDEQFSSFLESIKLAQQGGQVIARNLDYAAEWLCGYASNMLQSQPPTISQTKQPPTNYFAPPTEEQLPTSYAMLKDYKTARGYAQSLVDAVNAGDIETAYANLNLLTTFALKSDVLGKDEAFLKSLNALTLSVLEYFFSQSEMGYVKTIDPATHKERLEPASAVAERVAKERISLAWENMREDISRPMLTIGLMTELQKPKPSQSAIDFFVSSLRSLDIAGLQDGQTAVKMLPDKMAAMEVELPAESKQTGKSFSPFGNDLGKIADLANRGKYSEAAALAKKAYLRMAGLEYIKVQVNKEGRGEKVDYACSGRKRQSPFGLDNLALIGARYDHSGNRLPVDAQVAKAGMPGTTQSMSLQDVGALVLPFYAGILLGRDAYDAYMGGDYIRGTATALIALGFVVLDFYSMKGGTLVANPARIALRRFTHDLALAEKITKREAVARALESTAKDVTKMAGKQKELQALRDVFSGAESEVKAAQKAFNNVSRQRQELELALTVKEPDIKVTGIAKKVRKQAEKIKKEISEKPTIAETDKLRDLRKQESDLLTDLGNKKQGLQEAKDKLATATEEYNTLLTYNKSDWKSVWNELTRQRDWKYYYADMADRYLGNSPNWFQRSLFAPTLNLQRAGGFVKNRAIWAADQIKNIRLGLGKYGKTWVWFVDATKLQEQIARQGFLGSYSQKLLYMGYRYYQHSFPAGEKSKQPQASSSPPSRQRNQQPVNKQKKDEPYDPLK